ncbi:MAG TPA: TonB-dependent receptor [Candidatus Angelobacter sp.]|nr:TonB-dependent receptor [Candidatus Angelobacter sp.]
MRKSWYLLLALLLANIFGLVSAQAQERKATISGHITDADHAVLQGARVELQPNGYKTVSDAQGQFTISDLAPGHYTLTISYVGFAPFSTELDVTAGHVAKVDATLKIGTQSEVVEVRGERQTGEIEALNIERTADNIIQILPKEVITSLPNTNIADAVGRLPSVSLERDEGEGKYVQIRGTEPRLSNVTVDGVHLPSPENVRNVKLDAIPADLVEMVQVSKTLSANQEGDAIGGSVNLVTKSAGDKPYLSGLALGGYTPIAGGRWLNQFSGTAGNRFGKNKKLGIMFGGTWDWNQRGIDDVEPSVGTTSLANGDFAQGVPVFNGEDLREYWYNRSRYGFGGTLDYKLGEWSTAYIRGLFSRFKDFGEDWIYSPSVGSFASQNLTNPDGSSAFTHLTRTPEQRLFNVVAGARHDFGRSALTYELALGQARFTGTFPAANFVPDPNNPANPLNGGVQFLIDTNNPFTPKLTAVNANIFDPSLYVLDSISMGDNHTFERDIHGSTSFSRQYNLGSHFSAFEVGVKVRDAVKSELNNQQFFNADDTLKMSQVLRGFTNPDYYFHAYPAYGPTTDYNKILAFFNSNRNTFTPNTFRDNRIISGDFNASERVYAGYAMNTINVGHVRLQAGFRVESTDASFLGVHIINNNANAVTLVPGGQSYTDVLPSVQFQYLFGQNTILRAAYGIGIARPNFSDLPPKIVESDGPTPNKSFVSVGNPNLKAEHAQNFDLLIEHYLKPVGVIQAGVFYKYLTDPIFNVQTRLTSGPFAGFLQNGPVNGPHANLEGFEMAWQQQLSFLPGLFNGTGVRANYSYTASATTFAPGAFGGRTDHPALQRQAPNNWNFDMTYDKRGISARMGLSHNDANIFFYNFTQGADAGIKGPNGDQYLYPHTQVDAQVSYWIPRGHGFQAVVSLLNLNNEVFGFYQGSEKFPIQREYYNRTVSVGLRWTNSREK